MKRVLISGICGFVGSSIARFLKANDSSVQIAGFDSLSRPGSERNRASLEAMGIKMFHADVRSRSDLEALPSSEWVIDAAANPSVLAGTEGERAPRALFETNLWGSFELLEYCRRHKAGLVLLSSSRVYSIGELLRIPLKEKEDRFAADDGGTFPAASGPAGLTEGFSTSSPISFYGASKRASEVLALEYASHFGFPVFINRCGVLAGGGQFGRPDQGIVSFWIHSWHGRCPLRMIGFGGAGKQVRDVMHPDDLARLVSVQMERGFAGTDEPIWNVSGGMESTFSLRSLSDWCAHRFGGSTELSGETGNRAFDAPWVVLDSAKVKNDWNWSPRIGRDEIFSGIAAFAEQNPDWLRLSGVPECRVSP